MPIPVDLQNVFTRAAEVQRIQEILQQYTANQQQYFAEHFRELRRRRLSRVRDTEASTESVIYDRGAQHEEQSERHHQRRRRRRTRAFMAKRQEIDGEHHIDVRL